MNTFFTKKPQGYSLLELVIYIAIFSFITIIIIQSLLYAIKTYAVAQSYRRLQADGSLVLERITRDIRNQEGNPSGTFGTDSSTLTLVLPDESTTVQTTYQIQDGSLVAVTNGNSVALTSNHVDVQSFRVHSVNTGDEGLLRVSITLQTNGKVQTTATITNSIFLP